MIILLYTSNVMKYGRKLETCTGSTMLKLSVVLTNLNNIKCVTVTKHKTIAIHMCLMLGKSKMDGQRQK